MPAQPYERGSRLAGRAGRRLAAVSAASTALMLAACSGGDEQPDATPVGQSASAPASLPAAGSPSGLPASTTPATGTFTDTQAKLDVEDQAGRGQAIRVEDVQISNGTGFVAVYSAAGHLLGAAEVGITVRHLTVRLDRRVPRTSELLAILYADDGDRRFERATDPRIVDEDGDFQEDTFDYRLLR